MKQRLKLQLFLIVMFFMGFFAVFPIGVNAASSELSASAEEVNVGEEVTVTANITAGAWNLVLEGGGQSKGIVGQTNTAENSSASASITFKVTEAKEYVVKLSGDITDFSEDNAKEVSKTIKITGIQKQENNVPNNNTSNNSTSNNSESSNNTSSNNTSNENKTKSSEARLRDLGITPNDFTGFKGDQYEWSCEVPNEVDKVYIYATPKSSSAKVKSGEGNVTLKEGENKFEIVVVAEDGKTKKTYTLNITRKEAEQTNTPVEEPVIDEQPKTEETTSSTTISENTQNTKTTTSTTKTESTSNKSENQQIVGKVDWLKPKTWGQEQYILVAILGFLILTIIVSIILKIKIKKDEEEEIEFPGAEELDRAMFEHQELSDNGNIDDNYYNDDMNDENPYSTNFNDDYYNDNTQHDEEKINDQPVEVEYKEENTSNDYNANVSEKNDEDIERKRMLEEYFAGQDGKDPKVKRTKTKGKHF